MASIPSSGALISHLVSRVEADLSFLESHNLLTAAELAQIRSSLSEAQVRANGAAMELLAIRNDPSRTDNGAGMLPVPATVASPALSTASSAPAPAPAPKPRCKAIWDYNKAQPDDLGFKAGDIIQIEEEVNPDWWRGSLNGQTGLFPCNHVERLPPAPNAGVPAPPPRKDVKSPYPQSNASWSPAPSPAAPAYAYQQPQGYGGEKQSYQPPPPPQQQQQQQQQQPQQQPWNGIPSYAQAPPPPQQPQVVVDGNGKKKKFAGLGKTVGTAFAGGIGFGAGSAIANDAINAIF
ncbi:hypothetical protein JCM8202_001884 [Rhodotorula sphaerocarpa]